jgi:cytochrome oxidase Cu insertion factor (SCO1/SenC/PrrC family)
VIQPFARNVTWPLFGLMAGCAGPSGPKNGESVQDLPSSAEPQCEMGVEVDECPPPFALPDRTGATVRLDSFTDHVVVAFLFTGW